MRIISPLYRLRAFNVASQATQKSAKLGLTPFSPLCYSLRPLWDSNLENESNANAVTPATNG